MSASTSADDRSILNESFYGAHGYPHELWSRLRREAPICHFPDAAAEPFWAVTKHQDIVAISKQPDRFLSAPRLLMPGDRSVVDNEFPVRMLLNMDNPDHRVYRNLMHGKFSPQALRNMPLDIEGIAREIVDEIDTGGAESEIDFVSDVSAYLPIAVVADLLGVPRSDWRQLFTWTNEVIGSADPEYQREGENQLEAVQRTRLELFNYFMDLIRERRESPRDDIVSHLAKAKIDGKYLPDFELLSYFFLLVLAGNETTRNATTGGLLAFIENPGEWERLRRDLSLMDSAMEEVIRWTSPVIHFVRTAAEDCELRGQKIRAGERLCLFYPSANRDEDVFDEPFRFRIDRNPNRHIAFGIGEHFCLGANVARLELRLIYRELAQRLESIELASPPERLCSSIVGGVKHMRDRYRTRRRAA
jgi:cytochrome P450